MNQLDNIQELLNSGKAREAIEATQTWMAQNSEPSDHAYYILGNAYRKLGDWQQALNNYLEAISINPQSPAKEAYTMAMDILNFYHKDMFNQ